MEVMKLIKQIAKDNRQTIVMVTHDPRLADFADKIIHILDGKIQSVELIEHPIDSFEEAQAEGAAASEKDGKAGDADAAGKDGQTGNVAASEKGGQGEETATSGKEGQAGTAIPLDGTKEEGTANPKGKTQEEQGAKQPDASKKTAGMGKLFAKRETKEREQEKAPAQENNNKVVGQK